MMTLIYATNTFAHNLLNGIVYEKESANRSIPGVVVRFPLSNQIATTDSLGRFSVDVHSNFPIQMIVSLVGFVNDTVTITENKLIVVQLKKLVELSEVEVAGKKESLGLSTVQTLNTEKITEVELLKAACCNLSEAFETNPVINVAYKDAVTGAKEIQLLGLSGIYSQMLTENIPNMQGVAGIYGLTFIPGPWMESIQLTKGSGSVLNGYESTTGLINVEFKKSNENKVPRFYLNVFGDEHQSTEVNTFYKYAISKKTSTMLLAHGRYMQHTEDRNNDHFVDLPANKQINLYNRWQFQFGNRVEAQFGVKYLYDVSDGGEMNHDDGGIHTQMLSYKTNVTTERAEVYAKVGIVYPKRPQMSIGNILQSTYHDMNSFFGSKKYSGLEKTFYYQGIFQNYFFKLNHEYKVGFTYKFNQVDQTYNLAPFGLVENIPGVFLEYTYSYKDKFKLIAGVRDDYHFDDGWVVIPRLHMKYNFSDNSVVRMSVGQSYRRPYVFADHIAVFATDRQLIIDERINAERALNYGINYTLKFNQKHRPMSINADLYRTEFSEQLITDMYSDNTAIHFYNLSGTSYSNSVQFSYNVEVADHLDLRLAFKADDVKATYKGELREVPLVTKSRGLMNLAYDWKKRHWKFDYTLVWEGKKKLQNLPDGSGQIKDYSPEFVIMNAQVTKEFKRIAFYAGAENFLDFRQTDPIIGADNPFSTEFDATNVWGPISGRRIYAGLRFTIR